MSFFLVQMSAPLYVLNLICLQQGPANIPVVVWKCIHCLWGKATRIPNHAYFAISKCKPAEGQRINASMSWNSLGLPLSVNMWCIIATASCLLPHPFVLDNSCTGVGGEGLWFCWLTLLFFETHSKPKTKPMIYKATSLSEELEHTFNGDLICHLLWSWDKNSCSF